MCWADFNSKNLLFADVSGQGIDTTTDIFVKSWCFFTPFLNPASQSQVVASHCIIYIPQCEYLFLHYHDFRHVAFIQTIKSYHITIKVGKPVQYFGNF